MRVRAIVDILPVSDRPVRVGIAGADAVEALSILDVLDMQYEADDLALVFVEGATPRQMGFVAQGESYLPVESAIAAVYAVKDGIVIGVTE